MVTIACREEEIKVRGHAYYGEHGYDIVCAGVSALVQGLVLSIENLTNDKIKYEVSSGKVDIYFGNLSEKSRTLVDSFFIGICAIVDEYPDRVRIG